MKTITDELRRARRVGAPLVAIDTADQPAAIALLSSEDRGLNGSAPMIGWDVIRALRPLNKAGIPVLQKALRDEGDVDPSVFTNLVAALTLAAKLPDDTFLILENAHRFLGTGSDENVMQALMNLRDDYKATARTVVMLGTGFKLPPEIAQDVLMIDEPLPTPEEIERSITEFYRENSVAHDKKITQRAVEALRGLAPFPIESAAALAVAEDAKGKLSIDLDELWQHKRVFIRKVDGLTMEKRGPGFEVVGGLDSVKDFFTCLFAGPEPPTCLVFIDEIDKTLGGAGVTGPGDSSGTSQDALGVMLKEIEDREYKALTALGPPGTGKSFIARCVASQMGVPCFTMDMGAAKGSLVGESERKIRAQWKAINAVAGDGGALIIATCNRLDSMPPELMRRLARFGLWYFELPDADERRAVGKIHADRFKLSIPAGFWEKCEGWSSANIRDCCVLMYSLRKSAQDAAKLIIPAAVQGAAQLERLRALADGRFLSASKPGAYQAPQKQQVAASASTRRLGA